MIDICKQDTDKVLLVEGENDCHFVMGLCEMHNVPENFGIYACGGDTKVLKRLNALLNRRKIPKVIGIILDVDLLPIQSRWNNIQEKLRVYNYNFPQEPNVEGTIIEAYEDKPKLGFWLMPNNTDSGMLEDFCIELVPVKAIEFSRKCAVEAKNKGHGNFKDVHLSKAIIYSYLAWQNEPGYRLGKAIAQDALNSQAKLPIQFTNWLKTLFT